MQQTSYTVKSFIMCKLNQTESVGLRENEMVKKKNGDEINKPLGKPRHKREGSIMIDSTEQRVRGRGMNSFD